MKTNSGNSKIALKSMLLVGVLMIGTLPGLARDKYETIDAQAFGTGTQMGQNIGVTLNIYEFSTPADRTILVEAYNKGQNQGLSTRSRRMKAVGHVEITGTLGNDCSYIMMTPTPTGRKIVFVTNRQIRLGEALDRQPNHVLQSDRRRTRNQRSGQEQEHRSLLPRGSTDSRQTGQIAVGSESESLATV